MNLKCPNCGAVHSLDSLIGNDGAADLVKAVLEFDAAIGKAAIRYVGLFRPAKSQLTFARTAKLLGELLQDIKAREISRDGVVYPAPPEAWVYGFQTVVEARDAGRLKLPLKSHGYLYEVISGWSPSEATVPAVSREPAAKAKHSQTLTAAASLQGLKK
ncbi:hypothetical protein [Neisseria sp. S1]|uniref:hypothetical protein n=1 Tax=Neisseria sp. S1 TaxID=3318354 RepID=UPI003A859E81